MPRLTETKRRGVVAEVGLKWVEVVTMITVGPSMDTTGWFKTMVVLSLIQAMLLATPRPTTRITLKVVTPGCDDTFQHVLSEKVI